MSLKEVYTYFMQARELLLQTYEDYPYGDDWTEKDTEKFESALLTYNNYYTMLQDFLNENMNNISWKSEEFKKDFIKGLEETAKSDFEIFNCLKIRNKWHKEFMANLQSILGRMLRSLSSELFLQIPKGKGKFYTKALDIIIKEVGKEDMSYIQLLKPFTQKKYNLEWLMNVGPELRDGKLNDLDYNKIWKCYKYLRNLAINIFDGLTSTNDAIGFNGYAFQGKKYVPAFCGGGIALNRQEWLKLKDAYEDITQSLDYGVIREKRQKFLELEHAECPYSKGQMITAKRANKAWYAKYFKGLNESNGNVTAQFDNKRKRIVITAARDINTGEKLNF